MKVNFFKSLAIIGIFLGVMTNSVHASYAPAQAKFNATKKKLDALLMKNVQYIKDKEAFKKEAENLIKTLEIEAPKGRITTFTKKSAAGYRKQVNEKVKVVKKETTKAETLPITLSLPINDIKENEDKIFAG